SLGEESQDVPRRAPMRRPRTGVVRMCGETGAVRLRPDVAPLSTAPKRRNGPSSEQRLCVAYALLGDRTRLFGDTRHAERGGGGAGAPRGARAGSINRAG